MRSIRDCNVCVVGGAGFLGSHVVNHLVEDRNCQVLVVDNLIAGRVEFVHPRADFAHHDITGSEEHLRQLLEWHKVRFVLNYAARPYVPDSYDRPLRTFDVNAMGALKVINAAQEAGCEAILQVSSAEIYGTERCPRANDAWGNINEAAPVTPHSTYGAAKAAIDALVQVRWREARTPCIALRQFNCVGERDILHPYVVPEIVRQLCSYGTRPRFDGEKTINQYDDRVMVRLGNNSSRDFLYAGDAARMAVELLEKGNFGEAYNLGSERSIKIHDLARLIGKLMGFSEVQVVEEESRKRQWEIWHLQSDNTKIYQVIESRPKVSLEEALQRTVNDLLRLMQKGAWK